MLSGYEAAPTQDARFILANNLEPMMQLPTPLTNHTSINVRAQNHGQQEAKMSPSRVALILAGDFHPTGEKQNPPSRFSCHSDGDFVHTAYIEPL